MVITQWDDSNIEIETVQLIKVKKIVNLVDGCYFKILKKHLFGLIILDCFSHSTNSLELLFRKFMTSNQVLTKKMTNFHQKLTFYGEFPGNNQDQSRNYLIFSFCGQNLAKCDLLMSFQGWYPCIYESLLDRVMI